MLVFNYVENADKLIVNHLDGDKSHNVLSNFEWTDNSGNVNHAIAHGLTPIGEDHHFAKLTNNDVENICKELENPRYYGQLSTLARKYNVTENAIKRIASGENWTNISKKYNINYNDHGVDSILTPNQVVEICEDFQNHRYRGQYKCLSEKYGVSESTIKSIASGESWTNISSNYNFERNLNTKLSENQIHHICKIIESFGYFDMNVYNYIVEQLKLESTDKLMHNIRRLYRRDQHCYYNITSQYKWNY